jgi:hypothetical protein
VPEKLRGLLEALGRFWRQTLGQGGEGSSAPRIPFIDFARADGVSIGPGQEKEWTPNLVSEDTPWVSRYRGMWGLYAQDPIAGENAPAGPMHNRDGTPRPSWFDTLGFAELDRVPPPPQELVSLEAEVEAIEARTSELDTLIAQETTVLQRLGTELSGTTGNAHLAGKYEVRESRMLEQRKAVQGLLKERTESGALLEALNRRITRARTARADGPRAHIRHPMEPVAPEQMRFRRATELWAAISVSGLLVALALFILLAPGDAWAAAIVLLIAFLVGESALRGTFVRTVNRIAVILALIASVVLLVHFWKVAAVAALFGFAAFLIYERMRELRA